MDMWCPYGIGRESWDREVLRIVCSLLLTGGGDLPNGCVSHRGWKRIGAQESIVIVIVTVTVTVTTAAAAATAAVLAVQVKASAKGPVEAHVKASVKAPVEAPVKASVKAPDESSTES